MPDLRLPDGRIVKNIPEGISKQQIEQKLVGSGFLTGNEEWLTPKMSVGEAALTTATNPLGFGDEIKAGIAAGVAKLFGGAATKDIDIGDLYREARTTERAKLEKARQDRPLTSFAGQVFSDIGVAGKGLNAIGLGGQGLKTAIGGGAALGGASALGETEDLTNIPQTLEDVAKGVVGGGVVGGAVQKTIPALQKAVPAISNLAKKGLQKVTGINPEAVKTFQELGIEPTLADVSKSAGLQNFIKDVPLAGKPITEALQKQINDISSQIQGVVKSDGGTYTQAGKEILKGAENIIEKSKLRDKQLYGKVDEFIPAETPVSMDNTFKALQDRKVQITSSVSGGKVAGYNKFITDIQNNIAQGKQVPYDSLTALRSEVGTALQGKLEPQERSALNKIYSGLTQDIKTNIQRSDLDKIGKESALQAWEKANTSHRLRTRFIQENIQPLLDKGTPEEVYKYATQQSKIGGTRIGQIMRSLNDPQKDFIRSTLVKELGLAQKGSQGAEANIFDPQKFMAEYSVLKKNGTEKAIFTPEQVTAFNRLNKVVELTRNTEQAGKKNQLMQAIGLTSLGVSTGGAGLIPAIGGGRITANLMVNPKFINWLAIASQSTPKELPKQLNRLSTIAAANPEIREDVLNFVANFGVGDAEASDSPSEENFLQTLEKQKKELPALMEGIDIEQETEQYKKRYLKK